MTKPVNNKLAKQEATRRNKEQSRDLGHFEMRPRSPYEILGIKKPKKVKTK